jgi:diguanylate cyclase (GGDEF)-like protein/PAS domain S-box-containing protein
MKTLGSAAVLPNVSVRFIVFGILLLLSLSTVANTQAYTQANALKNAQNKPTHLTQVQLQLKWQHQFQFAGYYAAIEKGFYRDVGLDVKLKEASPGINPIQQVLNGQAEFGVGTSELLLNFHQGDPLVVLAVIMQHSPLALATLASSGITNIHQLASKPIMIEPNSLELFAYLKNEGIDLKQLQHVEHNQQSKSLIDGQVSAISIYTTDEPFELANIGQDIQLFRPIMAGIDFYGDNLFTTQKMIKQQPGLVKDFHQASLKGWHYAMQHPEEIIDLILSQYSQRKTHAHLTYEAEKMREIMRPDLVEIGYINPGRWQHIAQTYAQLGLLPENFSLEGMLYQTHDLAYQQLKQQLYYALILLLIIGLLAGVFYRQFQLANMRQKRFEALFLNAPISLIEIDHQGKIFHWNHEASHTFHYTQDEALGKNMLDLLVLNKDVNTVRSVINEAFTQSHITFLENENKRKDNQKLLCRWSNMPIKDCLGNDKRIICMATDITQEKQIEAKLYQSAHYDNLTGLPNRALLLSLLKEAIADAKRHQSSLGVLFIDLNDFKPINDTYGHHVGDQVLKLTGLRIQQALRENDIAGRLAGDEFIAIIKNLNDPADLQKVINNIMRVVQVEMRVNELQLSITLSIGSSLYPQESQDIQQLIQLADQSMYKVKTASKDLKVNGK